MARVAVAFVEIRPDMGTGKTGFAGQLKAALTRLGGKSGITQKVSLTPDTKAFGPSVAKAVKGSGGSGGVSDEADALGQRIGEIASAHITDNWEVDTDKIMEPMGDVADSMNEIMSLLGDEVDKEFVKAIKRRHAKRMLDAMQSDFDKVEREEKIRAKALAETFAQRYLRTLIGRNKDISHAEAANLKVQMLRDFGPIGEAVAEQTVKSFNQGLARQRAAMAQEARKLAADIEKAHAAAIKENEARTVAAAKAAAAKATQATVDETKRMGRLVNAESDKNGRQAGKTFADRFAKEMSLGANLRLGQLLPIIIGISFAAAPLADLLSQLAAGASAFAVALGEAVVAALAGFGASLAAVYQTIGTVALGIQGMNDALKAQSDILTRITSGLKITQSQLDKYNESMAQLAPNARQFAIALGFIQRSLIDIRKAVSQKLFAGMAGEIQALGKKYLPVLRSGLNATATVLNKAGREFAGFLRQAATIRLVREAMAGGTAVAERFARALIPLADAALRLLVAIQPLAVQIAGYAEAWAKAMDNSLRASASSGRLTTIIGNLQAALEQARNIVVNLWAGISNTFQALLRPGRRLLDMFEKLTARWADWTASVAGQNAIRDWGLIAIPVMHELGGLIGDLFRAFGRLAKVGDAGGFLKSLRGLIPPLEEFIRQLSASGAAQDFVNAMRDMLRALTAIEAGEAFASITQSVAFFLRLVEQLVTGIPPLTGVLSLLLRILTLIAAAKFMATITGLAKLPKYTGYIKNFIGALFAWRLSEKAMETASFGMGQSLRNAGIWIQIIAGQMRTATGRADVFAAALKKVGGGGVVTIAITAAALAFWGIVKAVHAATDSVDSFKAKVATLGGGEVTASVDAAMADLKNKLQKHQSFGNPFAKGWEETGDRIKAEIRELGTATDRLGQQYGSDVQGMVDKVREFGVSSEVSTNDIVVAMARAQEAAGNTKLSTSELAEVTARKFGAMTTSLDGYAHSYLWGALTEQIERQKYNGKTWAEAQADSIRVQIDNLAALYNAAYLTAASISDVNQLTYEKSIGRAHKAAKNMSAAIKKAGEAVSGGGGGGKIAEPDYSSFVDSATKAGADAASGLADGLTKLSLLDLVAHSRAWNAVGMNIARYLASGITSGKANIEKAAKGIVKKFGGTIKKVQDLVERYRAVSNPWIKELGKNLSAVKLTELLQTIQDFKAAAFETLTKGRGQTDWFGFIPTPGEVKTRLAEQLATLQTFTTQLEALKAKGLDPEWAKELLLAGPETAGNTVRGLQDATAEEVAALSAQYRQIGTTATSKIGTLSDQFFGIGENQVKAYIAGIKANQDAAVKSFTDIVNAQKAAMQKALGIKSPSKVFDAFGVDTVAGYIQGIESKQDATVAAIDSLYQSVTSVEPAVLAQPKIPAPRYANYAAAMPTGAQPAPAFDVRVYIGDRELTDIVRVEIDQTDNTQARNLLAGRRGG